MERAIVTSDIHIHTYKQFNENGRRLKNGIAYLDYLFRLADKNSINYILIPGDITNNMQIIATKVVNAIAKCLKQNFDKYPNVRIVAISGNHDFAEKNLIDQPAESALDYLAAIFPNFILLDTNYLYNTSGGNTILGIPYYEHREHFIERLSSTEIQDTFNSKVFLLMHQSVASGLPIEDDILATDPLFNPFTMIFCGHIHDNQQITDKFINVGSPIHRDLGDLGKTKGFWIVDLDDPIASIGFKDITDKFPQFIQRSTDAILTPWEEQQYIVWQPPVVADVAKDKVIADKFCNNLSQRDLLTNFCNEVLPENEINEKLTFGLTLLS